MIVSTAAIAVFSGLSIVLTKEVGFLAFMTGITAMGGAAILNQSDEVEKDGEDRTSLLGKVLNISGILVSGAGLVAGVICS